MGLSPLRADWRQKGREAIVDAAMTGTMRALSFLAGAVHPRARHPRAEPRAGEVRVRVLLAGICATDLALRALEAGTIPIARWIAARHPPSLQGRESRPAFNNPKPSGAGQAAGRGR